MSSLAPVLTATSLFKTYSLGSKKLPILKGISITVNPGEHVAIVGKSGSGKSTLLHLLGGLDRPDKTPHGSVSILGRDLFSLSESKRAAVRAKDIGFIFQSYHLLPEMTIVDNVILPAMAAKNVTHSVRTRAIELLEQMGLKDRLQHHPRELSGGEQQRVAIARALMNTPSILLADEPTGNLDATTSLQILDSLFNLTQTPPPALVIVTHDSAIAARCHRTLHLEDGTLQS